MTWDEFWKAASGFLDAWNKLIFVLVVILVAIVLRWILRAAITRAVERLVNRVKAKQDLDDPEYVLKTSLAALRTVQRTRTLGSVLINVATAAIAIVAVLLIFNELVPGATGAFALITAALGAGLGFGAQNLVKDVLNGLFMVSEDQLGVGDSVDLGLASGTVERVDIRVTQVRDINGTLWFVRNGEIVRVGNMSQGWGRVIVDLAVPYDSDVSAVEAAILKTATELTEEPRWAPKILDKPEVWGVESISAEAVVVRLAIRTVASARVDLTREVRVRIKQSLDEMGVRLPSLNAMVVKGDPGPKLTKPTAGIAE